jgi:hypothetical protein
VHRPYLTALAISSTPRCKSQSTRNPAGIIAILKRNKPELSFAEGRMGYRGCAFRPLSTPAAPWRPIAVFRRAMVAPGSRPDFCVDRHRSGTQAGANLLESPDGVLSGALRIRDTRHDVSPSPRRCPSMPALYRRGPYGLCRGDDLPRWSTETQVGLSYGPVVGHEPRYLIVERLAGLPCRPSRLFLRGGEFDSVPRPLCRRKRRLIRRALT